MNFTTLGYMGGRSQKQNPKLQLLFKILVSTLDEYNKYAF